VTREMPNKLEREIDGAFELLDRQLLDVNELMLGKVDDIELIQTDEGLAITALLTGPVALLHRLGASLGNEMATKYVQLRPSETNRSRPWRIPMDRVERLDSAVHLSVEHDETVIRDIETFRLGTLTGMEVLEPDTRRVGRVLDPRFRPAQDGRLVLRQLVIGHGHPGSLLGYDRWPRMGPWLIRQTVGWLHRHTCAIDIGHAQILWNRKQVQLDSPIGEISKAPLRR
jgi:sporulation protein YlmC with PRC-barrel domain